MARMPETTLQLPQGPVRLRDDGDGPPILFVHGLLVDGGLWREVTPALTGRARCLVPDLPLGAHRAAMRPDADLTPPGLAKLLADLLAELDLQDVTVVANDTGGALTQVLITHHPGRVGRVVLTNCDAFDNFPPKMFRPLCFVGGRVPGALRVVGAATRSAAVRRGPLGYGTLTQRPIADDLLAAWTRPAREDAGVRRDLRKALRGIDPRHTLDAAARLGAFEGQALLAWANEDPLFPLEHAHRLAAILRDAHVEEIPDSGTFVPLDRPERLARLVADFVGAGAPAPA
jgi:pimeloyl-ACP methyl ester carboxylesterase